MSDAEILGESDSNLTQHDLQRVEDVFKARKEKERGEFWDRVRVWTLRILVVGVPLGGGGGVAYDKYGPDEAGRRSMRNSIKIEKLGTEVVDIKDTVEAMPDYIIEAVRAEEGVVIEKPPALKRNDDQVEAARKQEESKKILEVSDEELREAMKEEGK